VVGLGPASSALKVAEKTGFPADMLYADPNREVYKVRKIKNSYLIGSSPGGLNSAVRGK
jgi:hypothetical protein